MTEELQKLELNVCHSRIGRWLGQRVRRENESDRHLLGVGSWHADSL